MESFLSLPRTAKASLILLLALVLLGWSLVAYSSKQRAGLEQTWDLERTRLDKQMTMLQGDLESQQATITDLPLIRQQLDRVRDELDERTLELTNSEAAFAALASKIEPSAPQETERLGLISPAEPQSARDGSNTDAERIAGGKADAERLARVREQDRLRKQEETMNDRLAGLDEERQALSEALEDERQKLAALKEERDLLMTRRQALEDDKAALGSEIASQRTVLLRQDEAMMAAKAEAQTLDERLSGLRSEVNDLETALADKQDEMVGQTSTLQQRRQETEAVRASLAALKADRDEAEANVAALNKQLETGEKAAVVELETLNRQIEAVKADLTQQNNLLAETEKSVHLAASRETNDDGPSQNAAPMSLQGGGDGPILARIPMIALGSGKAPVLPVDPSKAPYLVRTPDGLRLTQVHFEMASADLTPGALRQAKDAAAWIKERDIQKIRIVGHTDTIGTRADNQRLAKRRAASLMAVFTRAGIDEDRLEIVPVGEAKLRVLTDDQTAEPLNRCVGVFIDEAGNDAGDDAATSQAN